MINRFSLASTLVFLVWTTTVLKANEGLKVHGIFRSNMVLQRDKPIEVWGWGEQSSTVNVSLGEKRKTAKTEGEDGHWKVAFDPQPANGTPQKLIVQSGNDNITLDNILIGDIWVMNGQSNMAFALKAVYEAPFEASMAHLPMLRHIRINAGAESERLEKDLKDAFINGKDEDKNWKVVTPEVALEMGAIGYIFGSRLQRALQIPIGVVDNSRGGASLESLVPRQQFSKHPEAAAYLAWVDQRNKEFSETDFLNAEMEKWKVAERKYQNAISEDIRKGVQRNRRRPQKPDGSIRTWSVPGRSPGDAASCYNGMFGVFKGFNIKGVAFHQGYNNAMMNTSCKPKFYRLLMKLMIEGWREDFNDPQLPVAIIGLCAGGQAQTRLNFEQQGFSTAAYIREAQRLGVADVNQPRYTAFIPAYDQRIPQLHTKKKKELGLRAARWALNSIYGKQEILWETAALTTVERQADKLLLTFDQPVRVDDFGSEIEGFSIADETGVFYMAEANPVATKDRDLQYRQILVSSRLVPEPKWVRYGWSRAPMGNLKVNGIPWQPLPSFRTDRSDFAAEVSHMDPEGSRKNSAVIRKMKTEAAAALQKRLDLKSKN